MNNECEALLRVINKDGQEKALDYLLETKSTKALATMLIQSVIELDKVDTRPIKVSKEEYDRITNMFKIVGIRLMDDGKEIIETRGRKKKE